MIITKINNHIFHWIIFLQTLTTIFWLNKNIKSSIILKKRLLTFKTIKKMPQRLIQFNYLTVSSLMLTSNFQTINQN